MSNSITGYQSQNLEVLKQGCFMYVKNILKPKLLGILRDKASEIVRLIDSGLIPEYTANLHDATGVGVYADGALISFIPTARAIKATSCSDGGVNHYTIWGHDFLDIAIHEASGHYSKGIWFVLFSTVPYAYRINTQGSPRKRGKGFFNTIRDTAINDIIAGLRPISNVEVNVGGVML